MAKKLLKKEPQTSEILQASTTIANAIISTNTLPKKEISKRREIIGQGLISLGNLSLASLFFGQAFGGFEFDVMQATAGVVAMAIIYLIGYKLLEERYYAN